jgi:hypothetical protein
MRIKQLRKRCTAVGVIQAVQEQRFRLMTDTGQSLLLTLHNLASMPTDLGALQRAQAPVQVEYEGDPNLTSGVARKIKLIDH